MTTETHPCACGMDEPRNFPRDPVNGDRCPIGPLQLHHWHGKVCVFCGGTDGCRWCGAKNGEPHDGATHDAYAASDPPGVGYNAGGAR